MESSALYSRHIFSLMEVLPVGWYGSSTSRSCAYFMAERYRKSRFSLVVTFTVTSLSFSTYRSGAMEGILCVQKTMRLSAGGSFLFFLLLIPRLMSVFSSSDMISLAKFSKARSVSCVHGFLFLCCPFFMSLPFHSDGCLEFIYRPVVFDFRSVYGRGGQFRIVH